MTVSSSRTVWCDEDGCNEWTQFAGVYSNRNARKRARGNGWACGSHGDYCPDHNTK